jgi:single-stranded DNA-specific DHH superfamily exonuclease
MLTGKQIDEIREHLENAKNPIFYYDNDTDGLCSYVILRRFLGRGKGVAVRSFPDLDGGYARKAKELNADYVFVLDKPVLSKEFVDSIDSFGLPLVWIDHHDVPREEFEKDFKNVFIFNPARNFGKDKSDEPVTYLSHKITGRKEDMWLAVVGCIADHFLPEFVGEFEKHYPEFWGKVKEPFDAYFGTEIGRIAMALNFGLKDSVTHVVQMQNFLISCKGPAEVFAESYSNHAFRQKYSDVKKKYDALIEKAGNCVEDRLVFFEYGGELSISSDLSNGLSYKYPGKYVVVAYRRGDVANLSMRGKNVKKVLAKVLAKVDGMGGGHDDAVGARVGASDLGKFKKFLEEEIGK